MAGNDADTARLRWRCRRGVKELDVLMERFVAAHLPRLAPPQVAILDRLLDASDPDLMDWILERQPAPDIDYLPLLRLLRELMQLPAPG